MRFSPGTKLGNYEIVEPIGAGGMGEVYRARDLELEREVAIKVLPEAFADDEERVARLEREARLLASLNNPHIAAIHSLEADEGNRFLVLEVVEGETLQERLSRGPLPLDEAIPIARQIAEALEAAHGKGVIHRDLKPANIKLSSEGGVKVLDFGLAKASAPEPSSSQSESPTFTRHTETGVILGTAPYMSPEQARGRAVDKRTDIWAFGCVVYEMLTGRNAFRGDDVSATLAQILEREPEWSALPSRTPSNVRRLLTRCLEKEPAKRLRDAGDATLELNTPTIEPLTETADVWWKRLVWASVGLLVGVLAASWAGSTVTSSTPSPRLVRFETEPVSSNVPTPPFVLSADGSSLVYTNERNPLGEPGANPRNQQLFLRSLERAEVVPLRGTERAWGPFISTDGTTIGFFHTERQKFVRTSIDGGSPLELTDGNSRGASWGEEGEIVFSRSSVSGLWRLSADGTLDQLTRLDESNEEASHRWAHVLPNRKGVLFAFSTLATEAWDNDGIIAIASAGAEAHRILIRGGTAPKYVPTGHILFARDGNLLAVPFDLDRLEVTGEPVTVVSGIITNPLNGASFYDVANDGTLAVMRGGSQPSVRELVWVDRDGNATPLPVEPLSVMRVLFAPDGESIAIDVESAHTDVWSYELDRGVMSRLTVGRHILLEWSADGSEVFFASLNEDTMFRLSLDAAGAPTAIVESMSYAASTAPDGTLAYSTEDPTKGHDIWILPGGLDGEPKAFLQTSFRERRPKFSPDGRWLAYTSDESGREEVYVAPYPGPGRRWQVSTEGGREPVWAPDGTELFFRNLLGDSMMVAELELVPEFRPRRVRVLFEGQFSLYAGREGPTYDIHPDGQRFVMVRDVVPPAAPIEITLNWFTELERLVPIP